MNKDYNHIKDLIIWNVLEFMKTKKPNYKTDALSYLNDFRGYYHINLKKVPKIGLYEALLQFIKNDKGYKETINKLISSL